MRYPESMKAGGTIGFAAPSFGCATEPYKTAFDASLDMWKKKGYGVKLGPNCYASDGLGISSTPQSCAAELTEIYCGSDSDVMISCGGGELMCEILPFVDFDRIRSAGPKWFMGFSDNTNFTFTLTTMCDVASVYGPCAASFGAEKLHPSVEDAASILTGSGCRMSADGVREFAFSGYDLWEKEGIRDEEHPLAGFNLTEKKILKLYDEDARPAERVNMGGRLIGGCLDVLSNLCGTAFDHTSQFNERYAEDGVLWYLEACDLNPMSIRRAMWELENAGWFEKATGFIIGRPLHFGEELMGIDQYSAVLDIVKTHHVPVIMDADLGHLPPMVPMINGSLASVEADCSNWNIRMQLV